MTWEIFDETVDILLSAPGAFRISPSNPPLLDSARAGLYIVDYSIIPAFPAYYAKQLSLLVRRIEQEHFAQKVDKIFTTELTGIFYGYPVGHILDIGVVTALNEEKISGKGTDIYGVLNPGDYTIGVDDMETTKKNLLRSVGIVRGHGAVVDKCFYNFDRMESTLDTDFECIPLSWSGDRFVERVDSSHKFSQQEINELTDYIRAPLKWSLQFGMNHPEWVKTKFIKSIREGLLVNRRIIDYVTKTHPELNSKYAPLMRGWSLELGLKHDVPEIGYKPELNSF